MKHIVRVNVNGEDYEAEVEPRLLLVHLLRNHLGLTGTHVGCDTGHCGCCTVILNGRSVKSCLMFAVQADGAKIETVEGLARDGKLHPIQEAFWDSHAVQCGFCTPGFLMASKALLERHPKPTEEEVRRLLAGNYCRCTGYANIVKAVLLAAEKMGGR